MTFLLTATVFVWCIIMLLWHRGNQRNETHPSTRQTETTELHSPIEDIITAIQTARQHLRIHSEEITKFNGSLPFIHRTRSENLQPPQAASKNLIIDQKNQPQFVDTKHLNTNLQHSNAPPKHLQTQFTNLHVVTYATHGGSDDRFCRAVESAIMNNVSLSVLGWEKKWKGLSQKLEAAQSYSSSLPPQDVILFVDAFDVMFTKSANAPHLLSAFNALNASILFSAECGCWPHVIEKDGTAICLTQYPASPTPYRYLNSGSWMGLAGPASAMLGEVQRLAGGNFATANDQKLVADMFMSGKYGIKLDYHTSVFQAMHMTLDPPLPYCDPMQDLALGRDGHWINVRTRNTPAVFHFNGGGKRHHLEMEGKSWFKLALRESKSLQKQLSEYRLSMPDRRSKELTFKNICGEYMRESSGYNFIS